MTTQTMNMNQIISELEENGYQLTKKVSEAIYIFPDGSMIDGMFDHGSRGEDHRLIECLMDLDRYDNNFWDEVHAQLGVVRLVPETKYALITIGQELTKKQLTLIKRGGYEIEEY